MTNQTTSAAAAEIQQLIAEAKQRLALRNTYTAKQMQAVPMALRATPSCGFLDRPEFLPSNSNQPNQPNRKD